jgi:hypothetical protein
MESYGRIWQELTWSWASSTGNPALDQRLDAAAHAAWPYARLCAWTYLNDQPAAHDIMDHAVENASGYIARHPDFSDKKLLSRIKSVLKRRARQVAAKQRREILYGLFVDMEDLYVVQPEIEQRIYAYELFERLSPFAQTIVDWRSMDYSWREIAAKVELDHTSVRRAFNREVKSLLQDLSQPGEMSQCR